MRAAARLSIALALTITSGSWAEVPERSVDEGATNSFRAGIAARQNQDSARAHFRTAGKEYESVVLYASTPAQCRMAGNSWLLAGDLPRAIYWYRRGLVLDPDDRELQRGLNLARSRVAYTDAESRAALTPRAHALEWPKRQMRCWGLWLIAVANSIGWFAFARWIATRRPPWIAAFAIGVAVAGALTAAWIGERIQRKNHDAVPFVVVAHPAILRSGDGRSFMPRRDVPLPAGVEGRVVKNSGSWLQIELADGTAGWLPTSSVLLLD